MRVDPRELRAPARQILTSCLIAGCKGLEFCEVSLDIDNCGIRDEFRKFAIAAFDIWVMLAATLLLFCVTVTGWRVSRREGVLLLSAFAAYILYNVVTASQPQL